MADTDLDPQAFLKTVRDLSEKRQREDEERYERLEKQILQDRTARLERRAERERSLSPVKTPTSARSFDIRTPTTAASPSSRRASPTRDRDWRETTQSPGSDLYSPDISARPPSPTKTASPSAAMPSRANTMSWQRRPQSAARNRPLSVLAAENSASRASPEPSSPSRPTSRDEPSQQDIARSLSTKDPTWFRQTPDRGIGSLANRRSTQEESDMSVGSERRQLPGLMRPPSGLGVSSPSGLSPTREPLATLGETESLGSPEPVSNRQSTPEVERAAFGRTIPSLSSRSSLHRPTSPVRGMGGFVESAMMKRTDSVSKRWSNTQPTGLMRADSTASIRSGLDSARSSMVLSPSQYNFKTPQRDVETSPPPESIRSTASAFDNMSLQDPPASSDSVSRHSSFHSRSRSHASLREHRTGEQQSAFSPPLSPSKRYSPTKSSWLESALARPESPTKQPSLSRGQPAWMVELNKNKQQRNSTVDSPTQDPAPTRMSTLGSPITDYRSSTASASVSTPSNDRGVTPTDASKRDFTPPTKSKPAALRGSASVDSIPHPTLETASAAEKTTVQKQTKLDPVADSTPAATVAQTPQPSQAEPSPVPAETETAMRSRARRDDTFTIRAKPETPPKPSVTTKLQPKPAQAGSDSAAVPEFLNAFGKLKRTTTQNYVAPDIFKDNILRGKAGLAVTDGPQKTQRVDEFKDSILKKKAEMKDKVPEAVPSARVSQTPATPEALLVKKGLQRPAASNGSLGSPNPRRDITPEALARHKTLRGKPSLPATKLSDKPMTAPFSVALKPASAPAARADTPVNEAATSSTNAVKPSAFAAPSAPELKSKPSVDVTPKVSRPEEEAKAPVESKDTIAAKSPASAPEEKLSASPSKSNKFADRFNPALAGLLARGPVASPASASPTTTSPPRSELPRSVPARDQTGSSESKSGELTHMTKDRARGPKRRKPKASAAAAVEPPSPAQVESAKPSLVQPRPKSAAVRTLSLTMSTPASAETKTPTPTKSSTFPVTSSPLDTNASRLNGSKPASPSPAQTRVSSQNTPSPAGGDKENSSPLPSVKNAAAMWGRAEAKPNSPGRSLPIKLPSKKDEEAAMRSAGLLASASVPKAAALPSPTGPPKPAKSSRVVSQSLGDTPSIQGDGSTRADLLVGESGTEQALRDYFGSLPEFNDPLLIDVEQAVAQKSQTGSARTLRKSIHRYDGHGGLEQLPAGREYILFSAETYVVSHVYNDRGGRHADVFVWSGADADTACLEDAQVAAKQIARESSLSAFSQPSITVVDQACEPPSFFQALGGIVVVRRGAHAANAVHPYMLCGRPHLGQMAFDEVDLTSESLDDMFVYLVVNPRTIQDAQAYLWKGVNCSAEMIGSARLISMDLASSELIEVDAKSPPASFTSLFTSGESKQQTQTTSAVPVGPLNKIAPRLFRIDAQLPRRSSFFSLFNKRSPDLSRSPNLASSITTPPTEDTPTTSAIEVSPFSQLSFDPEHIYVLDCIASVLILPGPALSSDPRWQIRFTQACLFAQDYALLAAGLQDRPSIPGVFVILGSLPASATTIFRHWDARRGLWGAAGLIAPVNAILSGRDVIYR